MIPIPDWRTFQNLFITDDRLEFSLDVSRVGWPDGFLEEMETRIQAAFQEMAELEQGALANPDEGRQVGHYWLRAPELAPTPELAQQIREGVENIRKFAAAVHDGALRPVRSERFTRFLLIGIGGSALGPQLAHHALTSGGDRLQAHFFDNTDPAGFDDTLATIGDDLCRTLTLVISKSGNTQETRNGMEEARAAYEDMDLAFPSHAVAVTGPGSKLDVRAAEEGWLKRFPMYDWIGGRTSEMSAVGLLPAALSGFDMGELLAGARRMDEITRSRKTAENPAAMLALAWHHLTGGCGKKDMVVLPYKDRLAPFSRYLQQLVMESLGKERDRDGRTVHQGITVYGNKGSTDQHAYVQQLRDGVSNFFVTFIEVLEERAGPRREIEPGVTAGDYLAGFLLGTRQALAEKGRSSLTIGLGQVNERSLGALLALFERAVGLYASLVNINAYHQPGVEAGKVAAAAVIELQGRVLDHLGAHPGRWFRVPEIAAATGDAAQAETIFHLLRRLAHQSRVHYQSGGGPLDGKYRLGS
ncbi:MAG: glucose-6-phosphate isomerase [Acidobacteriota bacterium]